MSLGADGEISNLSIAPPVERIVNPVAAVFTVRVSEEEERVKAGAASVTVKVNVAVADPVALMAVTV
jgi:hypothetical protein